MRSVPVVIVLTLLATIAATARAGTDDGGFEGGLSLGGGARHWIDADAELGWRFAPWLVVSARAAATIIDDRDSATDLGLAARMRGAGGPFFLEPQLSVLKIDTEYDCLGPVMIGGPDRCVGGTATGVAAGLVGGAQVLRSEHVALELHAGVTYFAWDDASNHQRQGATLARFDLGVWFY